jgi:hypothetical protein
MIDSTEKSAAQPDTGAREPRPQYVALAFVA